MQEPQTQPDWQAAWQPVVEQVGQELGDDPTSWGPDAVEAGAIRRFLEPLEFDCSLHYDAQVARANGYPGIIAPSTSLMAFAFPPVWQPGEPQFTSPERNAQPARLSVQPKAPPGAPPVSGFFVADWSAEYLRPVTTGERLGRRGQRLLACVPKETRVGQGAFVTFESEIVDAGEQPVVRIQRTIFFYNPRKP